MRKLKIKDIIVADYLTLAQSKKIPAIVNEWLTTDNNYTLDMLINDQTVMFSKLSSECSYNPEVIKIEKLEWCGNWGGRKNDYNSDLTVWVTAIVDFGNNKIVRLSYDLLDSITMTFESGCSGSIHKPY